MDRYSQLSSAIAQTIMKMMPAIVPSTARTLIHSGVSISFHMGGSVHPHG